MTSRPTHDDVYEIVRRASVPDGPVADRIGIEAEWFPLDATHLGRIPITTSAPIISDIDGLHDRPGDNPSFLNTQGGSVTFEPGGQIEHSGVAHATIPGAFGELADTHHLLARALDEHGLMLVPAGIDHWNDVAKIDQQLIGPRYPAMASYFDRRNTTGRLMMRHTASLQINLDTGIDTLAERWVLANRLSPLLTVAFSTSPSSGYHSHRARVWSTLDPTRTGFPTPLDPASDPIVALSEQALNADVLVIIRGEGVLEGTPGWTLSDWLTTPHPVAGPPTFADVEYHLTTLFPEVRLRGGVLELRAIDGLPDRWCVFPAVLMAGALYDDVARDRLLDLTEGSDTSELWHRGMIAGLEAPGLADHVVEVFGTALGGAARLGEETTGDISAVADFVDGRLAAGATLADEIVARLAGDSDATAHWLANR